MKRLILLFPGLYRFLLNVKGLLPGKLTGKYPFAGKNEFKRVGDVLLSYGWNMNYGSGLMHEKLEEEFAGYIGVKHAVAVNTGGMAIQMSLRAMGVKPSEEVIHQVDTCVANAFAIMNSFASPVFSDVSPDTFMLSEKSMEANVSEYTRVIMPVHMWGNPENMDMIDTFAKKHRLLILEDTCLSIGAEWKGRKAGSFGNAGVFSFGCMKPLQAGEGGMITTNDESLARELRSLRGWGEMTAEFGVRDQKQLAWNGRMSEIVAAVALEQLRDYPFMLEKVRDAVDLFREYIKSVQGIRIVEPVGAEGRSSYNQVVLEINEQELGISKEVLMERLKKEKISCGHANFEPVTSLSFFSKSTWDAWSYHPDKERLRKNYNHSYINAEDIFFRKGIGINKFYFLNRNNTRNLIEKLNGILRKK